MEKHNAGEGITFTVSFPPSVNRYWRHAVFPVGKKTESGGRRFRVQVLLSADGRKYKQTVCREVLAQGVQYRLCARVKMRVELYPPNRRGRDLDNCMKALLDALVSAQVLVDDSQVADLRMLWRPVAPGGKAVVTIWPMPDAQQQCALL